MAAQVSAQLASFGEPRSFTLTQKTTQGALTAYVYKLEFASITIVETLVLQSDGKIAGLSFRPSQ